MEVASPKGYVREITESEDAVQAMLSDRSWHSGDLSPAEVFCKYLDRLGIRGPLGPALLEASIENPAGDPWWHCWRGVDADARPVVGASFRLLSDCGSALPLLSVFHEIYLIALKNARRRRLCQELSQQPSEITSAVERRIEEDSRRSWPLLSTGDAITGLKAIEALQVRGHSFW